MGKYFGTDGVRGTANKDLSVELAYKIGLSASNILTRNINNKKPRILIGKDTRISGDMFEAAIASGICAGGCDVVLCGVVPTPAVAFLVKDCGFAAGVMISASHNQAYDNGIKIFGPQGYKIPDELEDEIENAIDNYTEIELKTGGFIGRVTRDEKLTEKYIDNISGVNKIIDSRYNLKVLADCSNGSASATAEKIFGGEKVSYSIINAEPNGININDNCGSTHMDGLIKRMKMGDYDIGFAFDGDADRCLAVDETGEIIDGDKIICILAEDMKKSGLLKNNSVVVTKLSNMGLHKFCENKNINVEQTDVGDRYVLERMLEKGMNIGGEQSGHIIVSDYATTGDGQLTAVLILGVLRKYKSLDPSQKASGIFNAMKSYPQIALNVKVANDRKKEIMTDGKVLDAVKNAENLLNGNGRVLLRASGTEPLVRIMLEGEEQDVITEYARDIERVILEKLGDI
ncbi:MAG: phosphoglucosamine mutase [Oscillospiraceae bacterium]|nr:phosphoglucosamine mutase [Oscillospiraceae bacterium]